MILYDVAGRAFPISRREWSGALSAALRFGWMPAGTLSPPAGLEMARDATWDASYERPLGQTVTRSDAAAFAFALSRAAGNDAAAAVDPLIVFCRRSGFVLCEEAADFSDGLLNLAGAVSLETPAPEPIREAASV